MDSNIPHRKQDQNHSAAHGCCGSTHKRAVKQEKTNPACGCGDKYAKQKEASSCCG